MSKNTSNFDTTEIIVLLASVDTSEPDIQYGKLRHFHWFVFLYKELKMFDIYNETAPY